MIAPAAFMRRTGSASCAGTWSRKSGEPYVVRTPAVSKRSLTAKGTPPRGPGGSPRAYASVARDAASRASSSARVVNALTPGSTASIRAARASTVSRGETSRARKSQEELAAGEPGGIAHTRTGEAGRSSSTTTSPSTTMGDARRGRGCSPALAYRGGSVCCSARRPGCWARWRRGRSRRSPGTPSRVRAGPSRAMSTSPSRSSPSRCERARTRQDRRSSPCTRARSPRRRHLRSRGSGPPRSSARSASARTS